MYYFSCFAQNKTCFEHNNVMKNKNKGSFPLWKFVIHKILIFEFDSRDDEKTVLVILEYVDRQTKDKLEAFVLKIREKIIIIEISRGTARNLYYY